MSAQPTSAPLSQLLEKLRISLHVAFASLLGFALVQSLLDRDPTGSLSWTHHTAILSVAAVLAAIYVAGTSWENNYAAGRTMHHPQKWTLPWLGTVVGLWVILVAMSPHFVWLLFPLVFIILTVASPVVGTLLVLASWAIVAFMPIVTGRSTGIAGVVGPAVGVLFAVIVYLTYQTLVREAEHHRDIADQLRDTRDLLLSAENQAGRLAERERLSREIHDTLAQGFNSIVLLSRAASTALTQDRTEDASHQLATITETARENLTQARALVRGSAPAVTSVPLALALRQLADDTAQRQHALGMNTQIEVNAEDGGAEPPLRVRVALVRVAQEAVSNAVTHGKASYVRLTLSVWESGVMLDIFDNGHGFDPTTVHLTADSGFGLPGMRQRVAELNGDFTVDSSTTGTLITAQIPLSASPEVTR